ncbi:MAG: hypothetical protein ACK55Z_24975, partial [bacterium]
MATTLSSMKPPTTSKLWSAASRSLRQPCASSRVANCDCPRSMERASCSARQTSVWSATFGRWN